MTRHVAGLCCAVLILLLFHTASLAEAWSVPIKESGANNISSDGSMFSIGVDLFIRDAFAENEGTSEAAEIEARIQAAKEEMERARRSRSVTRFLFRLLLGVALVGIGITLAGTRWKDLGEPVGDLLNAVDAQQVRVGIVIIVLALLDIVLDLGIARPLVGDGLPQIAALLAGAIAIKPLIQKHDVLSKVGEYLARLDAHRERIGLGAIAVGIVHLIAGVYPII